MDSAIEKVDPDPYFCPLPMIGGQQPRRRIFLVQIFIDNRRLVDHCVAIDDDRHLGVGIKVKKVLGFVLEIDLDKLIGDFFLRQDNPCPVGVRSGVASEEFHRDGLLVLFFYHHVMRLAMLLGLKRNSNCKV